MPLKYYCPKCEKRFVDWGAEKLGFKCPSCTEETLYRVGTHPDGAGGAPALSKTAAKRKAKPRVKAVAVEAEFDVEFSGVVPDNDTDSSLEVDVVLDDGDEADILGDSLAIDDD